jgi:hypothetical protein
MMRPCHKFVDFVEANKANLDQAALWQHAECFTLRDRPEPISADMYWTCLSASPAPDARAILAANPDKINWSQLSKNPSHWALDMLAANSHQIDRRNLYSNAAAPAALALMQQLKWEINWTRLTQHASIGLAAFHTSTHWITRWTGLSWNTSPDAVALLLANQDKIYWQGLSANPAPDAVAHLQKHPNEIHWRWLCRHNSSPEALRMLEAAPEHIEWWYLTDNPGIFELDYAAMRAQMAPLKKDLLRHCMHPTRIWQAEHHWLLF